MSPHRHTNGKKRLFLCVKCSFCPPSVVSTPVSMKRHRILFTSLRIFSNTKSDPTLACLNAAVHFFVTTICRCPLMMMIKTTSAIAVRKLITELAEECRYTIIEVGALKSTFYQPPSVMLTHGRCSDTIPNGANAVLTWKCGLCILPLVGLSARRETILRQVNTILR